MNPGYLVNADLRRQFDAATERRTTRSTDAPLAKQQLSALQSVWADAVSEVPYYARLVAERNAPRVIDSWRDVAELPILSREILRDRADEFIRRSGPPMSVMRTAGSTGTPLSVGMNQAERDLMRVVKMSAWQAFGYDRSSRLFLIWGHAHLLGNGWIGRVRPVK